MRDRPQAREIGARIRALREFLGRTQAELAEHLGVQPNAVTQYESGARELKSSDLGRVAEYLEVEVGYFFGGAETGVEDTPPELQWVHGYQGRVYRALPPGKARDRYIDGLRAQAESNLALIEERLVEEEADHERSG